MATKESSKAKKAIKKRAKRVPAVKRLEPVRNLRAGCEGARTAAL